MKTCLALLILFTEFLAFADSAPDSKTQLRNLARLPSASASLAFHFDGDTGITLLGDDGNVDEAIAALQKEMRHDSSDAERYLTLAQLLNHRSNNSAEAKRAHEESIKLFRQRVESPPEDGPLLAAFGNALSEVDADEADHVLRKATSVAPHDWHCWAGLGNVLIGQSFQALFMGADEQLPPLEMVKRILQNKPTAAQLEASKNKLTESFACFDKAVALAPKEPKVYEKRGSAHCFASLLEMLRSVAQGEEVNPRKLAMVYFTGNGEEDFREIAKLSPTNYQAQGTIIMFVAMHEVFQHSDVGEMSELWGKYPEPAQKTVRAAMTSLNKLGDYPDKRLAAAALMIEGVMQFLVMGDLTASEKSLHQATVLDPSRIQAWELLDAILASDKHFDDLLAICEARLKYQATPRALYLHAKAEEYLDHYDKTELDLTKILERAPDDIDANLGMAAMLLKHEDEHSLFRAANQLERAKAALAKLPDGDDAEAKKIHLMFHYGIYCGLADQPDAARKLFQQIIDHDKNDKDAIAALKAIGNLSPQN